MKGLALQAYWAASFLYFLVFILSLLRFRRLGIPALSAVAANGGAILLIFLDFGHLPVFGLFESLVTVSFFLGMLNLTIRGKGGDSSSERWVWIVVLLLWGVTLFLPKEPSPHRYVYDYPLVILFHLFRNLALACALFSSAHFFQARLEKSTGLRTNGTLHQGRNFLLLSTLVFLISELVGILWCLNGWGDVWHWSNSFLQSALIVIFLMLAFHVPGKSRDAENVRILVAGSSGFFLLTLTLIRGLL
jgi:hypothetical protein